MKLMRQFVTSAVVAGSVLLPVGSALADTVALDANGPGSIQDVTINNLSSVVETTVHQIVVTTSNSQTAVSGDAAAHDNASVGNVSSGVARNANGMLSAVTVNNEPVTSGGAGEPSGGQTGTGSNGTRQPAGSVLGSSTIAGGLGAGAAAMLPVTGASQPVDVSALRAAWQAVANTPQVAAMKQSSVNSSLMLAVATVLAVLGGIGNVVYVRRKEGRS